MGLITQGNPTLSKAATSPSSVRTNASFRHGDLVALQQLLGLFFVAGDLHADVAGLAGDGGADALLVYAVSELHQALAVQPQVWYAAFSGFFHDGARAGPKARVLAQFAHALNVIFQFAGVPSIKACAMRTAALAEYSAQLLLQCN
jgi:hypothetical protein